MDQHDDRARAATLLTVEKKPVWRYPGETAFLYVSGLAIDADGGPHAYHPDNKGLDYLANAGRPGRWWGVVTDSGEPDGTPVLQKDTDPAPGYYVSSTSLTDRTRALRDPRRYVDSETIPYLALPPEVIKTLGVKRGDLAVVRHRGTGALSGAIFADVGPAHHLGEGSIALAQALGLPPSPKKGGTSQRVLAFLVFPGSGDGKPHPRDNVEAMAFAALDAWGGAARLDECVAREAGPLSFSDEEDEPRPAGLERLREESIFND